MSAGDSGRGEDAGDNPFEGEISPLYSKSGHGDRANAADAAIAVRDPKPEPPYKRWGVLEL